MVGRFEVSSRPAVNRGTAAVSSTLMYGLSSRCRRITMKRHRPAFLSHSRIAVKTLLLVD